MTGTVESFFLSFLGYCLVFDQNIKLQYFIVTKYIYIPKVPQVLSPRLNWGPPTPSPASEWVLPSGTKGGGGGVTHSPAREGVEEAQF